MYIALTGWAWISAQTDGPNLCLLLYHGSDSELCWNSGALGLGSSLAAPLAAGHLMGKPPSCDMAFGQSGSARPY